MIVYLIILVILMIKIFLKLWNIKIIKICINIIWNQKMLNNPNPPAPAPTPTPPNPLKILKGLKNPPRFPEAIPVNPAPG